MSLNQFGGLPEQEPVFKYKGDDSRAVLDFLNKVEGMNFMIRANHEHNSGCTIEELGVEKLSRYVLGTIADYKENNSSDIGFLLCLYNNDGESLDGSNLYISIGAEESKQVLDEGGVTGEEKLWIEESGDKYNPDTIYRKCREVGLTGPNSTPEA